MKRASLIASVVAIAICTAGWSAAQQRSPRPPVVAPKPIEAVARKPLLAIMGHDSAIKDRRILRITDSATWKALWEEHRGEAIEKVVQGWAIHPEIDFDRCIVIAVFRGDSYNCNGEFVDSINDRDGATLVRFDSLTFQTSSFGNEPDPGVRVTPYGIWILERDNKPLIIEENTQGLLNQPPLWTEKARFEGLD